MAKKLIDILKLVNATLNSNEISAAVGASDPMSVEISDAEFEKVTGTAKSLMTFDSAINNVEVLKALKPKLLPEVEGDLRRQIKASMYTNLEEKVASLGDKFSVDLKGKTLDQQLDELSKMSIKKADNKEYETLNQQFATFKETAQKQIADKEKEFEDYKVNSVVLSKIESHAANFAPAYKEDTVKSALVGTILNKIRSQAVLKPTDNGIKLFNPTNPEMELFGENNKKLGIDDVIAPLVQPYIQKAPPAPAPRSEKVEGTKNGYSAAELVKKGQRY